ncbi:MAG TPA: IPT/TIG domain-containing protein [Longimicrobiales bacterium]|nr:IPT/TIG domain-containing protein [Longimicrobiales bacterium]
MKRSTLLSVVAVIIIMAACGGDDGTSPRLTAPTVTSVSPTWGATGTEVEIHGTDFSADTPAVAFGTTPAAAVTPVSATLLRAVVPGGFSSPSIVDVRVTNPDGGSATLPDAFEVVIPPVLDSVAPATGTIGTEVRIYGSAFAGDSLQVFFSDLESPRVIQEGGSVFALAPEGLATGAAHDIRVVNRAKGADTIPGAFELVAPTALRINGVSKPTGLVGMTIIIDGSAFGDSLALSQGKVFFTDASGLPIEAVIADTVNDWSNTFIVTSVPQNTADISPVWVETVTGVSDSIEFKLIQSGVFSPSTINWTSTTSLPQGLQGLGAAFVPVEEGATLANYVFAIGGADSLAVPTTAVYRAVVEQTGALGAQWDAVTDLPEARAYHATVAATGYTAALDTTTTAAYLYALGGQDGAGAALASTHYVHVGLDGAVGAWQEGTPLPQPMYGAGAVLFRGYIYLVGGQDSAGVALATSYRARVFGDGSMGPWETLPDVPRASAFGSLVNFGPYIYSIGGDSVGVPAVQSTETAAESPNVYLVRLNLRTGGFQSDGWILTEAMAKGRSKLSAAVGGGAAFVTSGVYAGQAGSSENTYADFVTGGAGLLGAWQGATGAEIIANELGYSIYNQAAVYFIDQNGNGHVLVLGGARRDQEGVASAGVVYY